MYYALSSISLKVITILSEKGIASIILHCISIRNYTLQKMRNIGNTSEGKQTKNFTEDFIERLKFVGNVSEE